MEEVYREQLLAELAHVRAALAADRQTLADMTAAGTARPVDPTAIKPGDAIRTRGRWEKMVRVNRTTVSVATGYRWTDRVSFTEITGHRPAAASDFADRAVEEERASAVRAPDADNLVSVSDTPEGPDMSAEQSPPTHELVGISVIAGWFGVTRPAVAHWMERHPNFPAPDVRIRQPSTKPNGQVSYVYGWRPEREAEIREWERSRPGQGAGGGRPWPAKTSGDATGEPASKT